MLAASIRASFHGGRISRRDIGNNEFIKAGRAEIGNTVSLAQVAVNSPLVFLSLFQSHRDIPGVAIFLVESTKEEEEDIVHLYIYICTRMERWSIVRLFERALSCLSVVG